MSDLKKLQRFLPVGALGISLILHLAIFLGISGIIIIQAVAPKIIPSGEYAPAGNVSDLPPAPDEPDNLQDDPTTLPEDALTEAPPIPNFGIDTISAAAPTTTASFVVAPPTSMMNSSAGESNPQAAPKSASNANKSPGTPRAMANPFGNANANPEDGGLVGYFYDFKQTKDRKPSPTFAGDPAKDAEGFKKWQEAQALREKAAADKKNSSRYDQQIEKLEKEAAELRKPEGDANQAYREAIKKFVTSGWPPEPSGDFFKVDKPLTIYQLFVPDQLDRSSADEAPLAFKVQNLVKPRRWIIVYRGAFTAPESGRFRFVGLCDDILIVRMNKKNILDGSLATLVGDISHEKVGEAWDGNKSALHASDWFTLTEGQTYPLDILIGEQPGGRFYAFLTIESKDKKYTSRPGGRGLQLPIFQFIPTNIPKWYEPERNAPSVAKESFICQ